MFGKGAARHPHASMRAHTVYLWVSVEDDLPRATQVPTLKQPFLRCVHRVAEVATLDLCRKNALNLSCTGLVTAVRSGASEWPYHRSKQWAKMLVMHEPPTALCT
mmetsp:Transcript_12289/g.32403  ORF Transcript_12289/g.32403 Transcript_12289/m.32403 type:complete len:105 (+) Transcript_12289:251-565(+)|eukprot:1160693-Pelagomonas_calceolata.AAC.3